MSLEFVCILLFCMIGLAAGIVLLLTALFPSTAQVNDVAARVFSFSFGFVFTVFYGFAVVIMWMTIT